MGELRVHELAKKLGLANQELLDKLNKAGMGVKTHSSTVDEGEAMKALSADKPKPAVAEGPRPRTLVRRAAAEPIPEPPPPVEPPVEMRPAAEPLQPAAAQDTEERETAPPAGFPPSTAASTPPAVVADAVHASVPTSPSEVRPTSMPTPATPPTPSTQTSPSPSPASTAQSTPAAR